MYDSSPDQEEVVAESEQSIQLEECPVCGAVGLPERIAEHDCSLFRKWEQGDCV